MAQIRLIPSTYYLSSTYLSVSNASNMYSNTDSTSYATVTNNRSSTSSYYIYIRGFNFDDVPSDAIVNSITIKLKAYHSGGNTSTIYGYNGTTQVSSAGSTTALDTSATVQTFTNTTIDWDTLSGYGSNFGIRINCRRSSRNTTAYVYIYGAEILVDYTIPVYHSINITGNNVDPSGSFSVLEGNDLTIKMYYQNTPTVTDNNIDVTSQVTESSIDTATLIPQSYTNSGFTVSNISNAYTNADDNTYAQLTLSSGGTTGDLYLNLGGVTLPSGAVIQSVSCQATFQYNRNGSSSGFTAECQMYSGTTYKGSTTSIVSAGGTDVAKTKFTLSPGTWTTDELSNARLYLTATNNAYSTSRYLYVYGVSFDVTYTFNGKIYIYTLTNIIANHTIVVVESTPVSDILYWKNNGSWVQVLKAYKNINGSWIEQSDLTTVFSSGTNYVKGD